MARPSRPLISQVLEELLEARHWSGRELHRRLRAAGHRLSYQAVNNWIRGVRSPSPDMADALVRVFELDQRQANRLYAATTEGDA
jgi:transcriptional regulator with XRE-family HTH domain